MMDHHGNGWHRALDIKALQRDFGSPLWIVSEDALAENVRRFTAFTGDPGRILYPVKANPAPAVLQALAALGCGADCANLSEIRIAQLAGIPTERIAYNSPLQELGVCLHLLRSGGTVVLDDPSVIAALEPYASQEQFPGRVWLRINPLERRDYARQGENQDLMSHGSASSKFGIPAEQLAEILRDTPLRIQGFHLHVGTQMDNLDAFRVALSALYEAAALAEGLGHPVDSVDIGGGLGIPFSEEDRFPSVDEWASALEPLVDRRYLHHAEPGHALVGNAVALLTTVATVKESRGRRWAVCDVGTDQLAKVTLLHWPHQVYRSDGTPLPRQGNDALAGPLCFAGDNLLPHTSLEGVQAGDPLLIGDAGAYTHALSNGFNGRTAPAWAVATAGGVRLATDRERKHARTFFQHHRWTQPESAAASEALKEDHVDSLQSEYLSVGANSDTYRFTRFERCGERNYRIKVDAESPAGFVSMPFVTRIVGDAAIVALMHELGRQTKDTPVWGERLEMDYSGIMASGPDLSFELGLSHLVPKGEKGHLCAVTFMSSCGNLHGSLLVHC